ncbi:MAG: hypothetical protein JNK05_13280 [Myxococcales bacterium]|nr:hypothetical protein [Myxococcales bacterium]
MPSSSIPAAQIVGYLSQVVRCPSEVLVSDFGWTQSEVRQAMSESFEDPTFETRCRLIHEAVVFEISGRADALKTPVAALFEQTLASFYERLRSGASSLEELNRYDIHALVKLIMGTSR